MVLGVSGSLGKNELSAGWRSSYLESFGGKLAKVKPTFSIAVKLEVFVLPVPLLLPMYVVKLLLFMFRRDFSSFCANTLLLQCSLLLPPDDYTVRVNFE